MAITIDWATKIINVPKADTTLIQISPTEIRELNLDAFRLRLKELEAGEAGIVFIRTHNHNTEVLLGGITYARIIEIINGYTVTFEDGQYAVNLVGANSNVGDVVNVNQVSVRSQNSAGLISSPAIEYASFSDAITVDQNNVTGNATFGTQYPTGTLRQPVDNLDDALLIATFRGFNKINIIRNATISSGDSFESFVFVGQNANLSTIMVDPGATVTNCEFTECTLTGTLDGGSIIRNSVIYNLNYVNGVVFTCMLAGGTISLGGTSAAYFLDCKSGVAGTSPPVIDMSGGTQELVIRSYDGGIELHNKTGPEPVGIDFNSGQLKLDTSVVNGTIVVRGDANVIELDGTHIPSGIWNGGPMIVNETTSLQNVVNGVWNSPRSDHNADDTMAKMLQELYKLQGLDINEPLTITQTQRVVDDVNLALGGDGVTIQTVTRQP